MMAVHEHFVMMCLSFGFFANSEGLKLFMERTPNSISCGRLMCTYDAVKDTHIFTALEMTIYDITQGHTKSKLASLSLMSSGLLVDQTKSTYIRGTGNISRYQADLTLEFQNETDCLFGSFQCELDFVDVRGQVDVTREFVLPEGTIAIIRNQIAMVKACSEQLEMDVADLKRDSKVKDEEMKELRRNYAIHDKILAGLKRNFTTKDEELADLRRNYTTKNEELAELRRNYAVKDEELAYLRRNHTTKDEELAELRRNYAVKDEELADLRRNYTTKDEKLADLRRNYATKDEELADLRRNYAVKDEELAYLRRNCAVKDDELAYLRRNHTTKAKELAELRRNYTTKDEELADLRRNYATKDEELADLRHNCTTKDEEMADLRRNYTVKDKELAELRRNYTIKDEELEFMRFYYTINEEEVTQLRQNNTIVTEFLRQPKSERISSAYVLCTQPRTRLPLYCYRNEKHARQKFILWRDKQALCDANTEGGGWVIIQRRTKGDVDFYRNWKDYKNGFGTPDTDFWIGNDVIHNLTSQGYNELRVDMNYQGMSYFAHYSHFSVGDESSGYMLSVNGYRGTAGDNLVQHIGSKFSTFDMDLDLSGTKNCAVVHHAGYWCYSKNYYSNLNGQWGGHESVTAIIWWSLTKRTSLSFVEMKIRLK